MNTILFLSKAPPYVGTGAERMVWELGMEMADNGWDVHYLCPDGDSPAETNITFHEVLTPDSFFMEKASFFITGIQAFRRIVEEVNPDLIYDNSSPFPFLYAYLAEREKTVTKVHAIYGLSAFQNKDHPITKIGTIVGEQLYRVLDGRHLLTISESTKERLSNLVSKNEDQITVVRNGIDITNYEYHFSPGGPVLALSALTPRKNISCLLRAWKQIEDMGIERQLLIAGDGPRRDSLESLRDKLSLEQVTFLGYVPEEEKTQLLSEAFVYVLPTRLEGFGLSNMEAMASGCVVISSNTWGVKDYLNHGKNGFTVPVNDIDQLAAQLCEILEQRNDKILEEIAECGRETAERHNAESSLNKERQIIESYIDAGGIERNPH